MTDTNTSQTSPISAIETELTVEETGGRCSGIEVTFPEPLNRRQLNDHAAFLEELLAFNGWTHADVKVKGQQKIYICGLAQEKCEMPEIVAVFKNALTKKFKTKPRTGVRPLSQKPPVPSYMRQAVPVTA